jgi:SPP1 gp7 family putative phage head morphogenesis protein
MRNDKYWANRMRILEESLLDKGYDYVKNLERQYATAIQDIESQIARWYQRFAAENGITLAEANKLLTTQELDEFRWTVEEYIKHGQENAVSQAWLKQLKNASARVHVSRLDSLKLQLQEQAEALHGAQTEALNSSLSEVYQRGYYHTAFELQKGIGVGWTLHGLTDEAISKVLSRPWTLDSQTFSDRIWANKQALVNSVNTQLTQMIMRGAAPDKAIKAISDRFRVSKSQAGRLVMTESAAFANEARKDCFKDLGVEKYVIVETLDNETCSLCAGLDGKVYPMSEYQVGVTAPPFHPWCRGTTAPYYEDMQGLGDRFARDGEGKGYDVPRDMKFTDWKEKYVVQPEKTRYNIFKSAVLEELKGYSTSMHSGNQSKHIRGGQNFDLARGELTVDPQMLYDRYSGKGQFLKTNAGDWNHKERFTHTETIGIYRSKYTGKEVPTNTGIIHYSKRKGWHIVPARPQKGAAK